MKLPKMEDCEFVLEAIPEDLPVRGNVLESGNEAEDKACEDEILARLDRGDVWAWANVCVSCIWKGWEGSDYLGCCSYKDADDFKQPGGYFEQMKLAAYEAMLAEIERKTAPLAVS